MIKLNTLFSIITILSDCWCLSIMTILCSSGNMLEVQFGFSVYRSLCNLPVSSYLNFWNSCLLLSPVFLSTLFEVQKYIGFLTFFSKIRVQRIIADSSCQILWFLPLHCNSKMIYVLCEEEYLSLLKTCLAELYI